jgi:acyl-CoA thioesterase FadM
MILFGKTLKILVSNFFKKKRVDPFKKTNLFFKVWPTDIDINFHMNNGRFLTVMDYGRFDYYCKLGLFSLMFKKKALPVTGGAFVQFRRPLGLFKNYRLETELVSLNEKWFYFDQKIFLNDELCCRLLVKALWLQKGVKIAPKEIFQDQFPAIKIPEFSETLKAWKDFELSVKDSSL